MAMFKEWRMTGCQSNLWNGFLLGEGVGNAPLSLGCVAFNKRFKDAVCQSTSGSIGGSGGERAGLGAMVSSNGKLEAQQNGGCDGSRPRPILAQVLATSAKSLLYLSLGMLIGLPTVLIPVLTEKNIPGELHLNNDEAAWYGSLTYIAQPIGSIASGALLQSVGCKRLMILVNIPQFVSWIMTYYSSTKFILYSSSALVGLVIGMMESPTVRYICEISHPNIRGILTTYSTSFCTVGFLLVYLLGSLTDWRTVVLVSATTPIITIIALLMIPETPIWLMSKGRPEEAMKSLQWLRGWTTPEMVKEEYSKLEFYGKKKVSKPLHGYDQKVDISDESKIPNGDSKNIDIEQYVKRGFATNGDRNGVMSNYEVEEERGFATKWRELTKKEMLVPLFKCIVLFFVSICSGLLTLRPFLVQIFGQVNLPVAANWTAVLVSVIAIFGNIVCMLVINRVKRKPLLIFTLVCTAICLVLLGIEFMQSTPDESSFRRWWTLFLFFAVFFFNNIGIYPISWAYLSEILPYKGRGIATGVGASAFYIVIAVGVKLYPDLEQSIGLHGIIFSFAAVSFAGALFTQFFLPETEGRFLSDIETEVTHLDQKGTNKVQATNF